MKREERLQLLKDTLLYFEPRDRFVTDENGIKYYREDVVLKAMEMPEHPLPPAEGTEEILRKPKYNSLKNLTLICEAMTEFATLHAQRLAEKMVEERLREELIAYVKWYGSFSYENLTDEMLVDEYLSNYRTK